MKVRVKLRERVPGLILDFLLLIQISRGGSFAFVGAIGFESQKNPNSQ
jgi:hypothetical protein